MPSLTEAAIAELDAQERLSLIAALWDSLTDEQAPLTEVHRAELEQRLANFERDKLQAGDWDALKAELRSRST